MPITFRHDAAAGLIGSFAAGQAAGRRRNQKYNMALLLQDRRDRNRLRALGGARGVRARAGGGAAGDQIVGFQDPLADNTVHGRAAMRARARKERLAGRGRVSPGSSFGVVPDSSRRIPITQADIDQQGEQQEADAAAAADERDRLAGIAEEERTFTRKILGGEDFSDTDRRKGNEILAKIAALEGSPKLSEQDEQAKQAKIAELEQDLQDVLDSPTGIPQTSPDDLGQKRYGDAWEGAGLNKVISFDDEGTPSLMDGLSVDDLPDETRIAMGLRPLDTSAADQKKADAQQKAIEAAEDAHIAARVALEKRKADDKKPEAPELKLLQDQVDLAKQRLDEVVQDQRNRQPDVPVVNPVGPPVRRGVDGQAPAPAGALGPDDLRLPGDPILPDPESDLRRPGSLDSQLAGLEMGGAQPAAAVAEPGSIESRVNEFSRKVDAFNRVDEELVRELEKIDNTSESQVNAYNRKVDAHNRLEQELSREQESLVKAEREAAAAAFAGQHGVKMGEGRSIPGGFPEGSQSIGDNGILLPDGRVIIPKGR